MRNGLLRVEFYETYYYANLIQNVLSNPFAYIRSLHEWGEGEEHELFAPSFPKLSRLHTFISFVIYSVVREDINPREINAIIKDKHHQLWLDRALRYYRLGCPGFRRWLREEGRKLGTITEDDVHDYYLEQVLAGDFEDLLEQMSQEVFYILFSNRGLLRDFNAYCACRVRGLILEECPNEYKGLIRRDGVLRRAHIPEWARRAVFFRDRGACAACNIDISGLISARNEKNFDHIIPLKEGGLNDVTNLQLLCDKCNSGKGGKLHGVSAYYERWYPPDSGNGVS